MPRKKSYKLDRVAIRMVKEPPLYSEEPLSNPETAIKILRDVFKEYDREVVCVVNLKTNMQPVNLNIVSIGAIAYSNQIFLHPGFCSKSASD